MTTPGGGGTGNLGGINFLIKVGTQQFKKGLKGAHDQAKKQTGKIGGFFSKMQGRFQGAAGKIPFVGSALAALATPAGLATAAIGALVGGLAASIKSFVSTGDEIQKMATRTGFSTEALSEMRHALQISGSDIKGFENGIRRMSGFHRGFQGRFGHVHRCAGQAGDIGRGLAGAIPRRIVPCALQRDC